MRLSRLKCVLCAPLLVLGVSSSVYAVSVIRESYVSTETSKVAFIGEYAGGQLGASMSTGDFNGDGISDLFVGAPFTSTNEKEWNGLVKIIFGGNPGDAATPNLDFYGDADGDQLGTSVASGDFNGDGLSDLVVGAYNAMSEAGRSGKVYVLYGSQNPIAETEQNIDLRYSSANIVLAGLKEGDGFGLAVAVSDVNDDGIDDLLVGAPFSDTLSVDDAGSVYAYFGSVNGLFENQNILFRGQSFGERFGAAIAGGDIDGDAHTDILISAYTADTGQLKQAGKVYIYKGKEKNAFSDKPHAIIDDYDVVLSGSFDHAWFGFDLALGDLNSDRKDDIAISHFSYKGDRQKSGVEIYMSGDGDLLGDVVVKDPVNDSLLGASVLLRDLNKDTKSEIIIGAPGIGDVRSTDEGDVYIVYSGNAQYAPEYSVGNNTIDTIIHGENSDDWFGYSMEVLDFNGDGLRDLAVGSRYSDDMDSMNNGKVFILLNNGDFFGKARAVLRNEDDTVTRAELVDVVLDTLGIKKQRAGAIKNCHAHLDFCLFNFMAMSSYDGISLDPELVLYPDVPADHMYADSINTATLLEIVNGYMSDSLSPFYPDKAVSRIEALKVVLGAADLVEPKHKFEMIELLGSHKALLNQPSYFNDVDSRISHMWWYPRYTNFAVDKGIIDREAYFRPYDNVTADELLDMLERTLAITDISDEEAGA